MSKSKKQNDGVRDPSPIKKQAPASPLLTQAAAQISAPTPSHSSTAVVAKGGARGADSSQRLQLDNSQVRSYYCYYV